MTHHVTHSSYRREDSASAAGRIFDRLRAHFGNDAVFMDIDTIPFGEEFREHIDTAVSQCEVVLAVVGRKWAGKSKTRRRIDDPRDFVRIELESALARNLPVIPILIDHARMPGEADLPSSPSDSPVHTCMAYSTSSPPCPIAGCGKSSSRREDRRMSRRIRSVLFRR